MCASVQVNRGHEFERGQEVHGDEEGNGVIYILTSSKLKNITNLGWVDDSEYLLLLQGFASTTHLASSGRVQWPIPLTPP